MHFRKQQIPQAQEMAVIGEQNPKEGRQRMTHRVVQSLHLAPVRLIHKRKKGRKDREKMALVTYMQEGIRKRRLQSAIFVLKTRGEKAT